MVHCKLNNRPTSFYLGSHEVFEGTEFATQIEEGDLDVYSSDSPIGKEILGLKVGDSRTFKAPNGKEISVEITGLANFEF